MIPGKRFSPGSCLEQQVFAAIKPTLFISDLHLSPEQAAITDLFLAFLDQCASRSQQLYILGDLFDAWIGDDAGNTFSDTIIAALHQLQRQGTAIAVMHGNRDFLLGDVFTERTGCQLLDDPTLIELDDQRILLSHGDVLCTDDREYQAFRRHVRDPAVQQQLLALSVEQRIQQARQFREQSKAATLYKAEDIMDVNADAVSRMMQEHQVDCLIHGHTHRPAIHTLDNGRQRIVLGDWGQQGSVLIHDHDGLHLHHFTAATLSDLARLLG